MMIVQPAGRSARTVYAWQEGDEFMLSPFEGAKDGRRPIGRYNTAAEIEAIASQRGISVVWQTN